MKTLKNNVMIACLLIILLAGNIVFADNINLTVGNANGTLNDEISIPVRISVNSGMTNAIIDVTYDNNVLKPVDYIKGTILTGMTIINLNYEPNKIRLVYTDTNKVNGEGDLVTIKFKVIAEDYDSSSINLTVNQLRTLDNSYNPIDIEYNITNGEVTDSTKESDITNDSAITPTTAPPLPTSTPTPLPTPTPTPTSTPIATISPDSVSEPDQASTEKFEFTDLGGFEWAKDAIYALAEHGIIKGESESIFAPDQQLKRADYLLLMVRMLGLKSDAQSNFDDVASDKYYYKEVGTAKTLGLISGVGDNKFNPEDPISRQDLIVLTSRMLEKINKLNALDDVTILNQFADGSQVAEYAKSDFAAMVRFGFIKGTDNHLNPEENASRAETAVFVYRIYNLLDK